MKIKLLLIILMLAAVSNAGAQNPDSAAMPKIKLEKILPAGSVAAAPADSAQNTRAEIPAGTPADDGEELAKDIRDPFVPKLPVEPEPDTEPVPGADAGKDRAAVADKKPGPEKPNWKIQGLIWNTDRPQAIVNNQVVNLGDFIQEWKITGISKAGIAISCQDVTFLIEP